MDNTLIYIAIGLFFVVLAYLALRFRISAYKVRKYGIKTEGIVLDEPLSGGLGFVAGRFYKVRFKTREGREITAEGLYEIDISEKHDSSIMPDEITVYYDPNKPESIAIGESGINNKSISYILAFFIIALIPLIVLVIIL